MTAHRASYHRTCDRPLQLLHCTAHSRASHLWAISRASHLWASSRASHLWASCRTSVHVGCTLPSVHMHMQIWSQCACARCAYVLVVRTLSQPTHSPCYALLTAHATPCSPRMLPRWQLHVCAYACIWPYACRTHCACSTRHVHACTCTHSVRRAGSRLHMRAPVCIYMRLLISELQVDLEVRGLDHREELPLPGFVNGRIVRHVDARDDGVGGESLL